MSNAEFCINAEKDLLCFYKNSTNQTYLIKLTNLKLINNKVLNFKKDLAYQV